MEYLSLYRYRLHDQMLQSQRNIHVGGYGITPSSIGSCIHNLPTWCSDGSSRPDYIEVKKIGKNIYQTKLSGISAGSVLTVTTWRPDNSIGFGSICDGWVSQRRKGQRIR